MAPRKPRTIDRGTAYPFGFVILFATAMTLARAYRGRGMPMPVAALIEVLLTGALSYLGAMLGVYLRDRTR